MKLLRHSHHAFEGQSSRRYNAWATGPLRWVYRSLAREIAAATPHGATVLDIGTGPGVLLVELARMRPDIELIGVDISADMVASAERNLASYGRRATVHVGDVARLPFADHCVDLVVSSLSLHHWADPAAAVPELARVLRPGGRAFIYDIRRAPFEALVRAAHDRSVFTGAAPLRATVRLGWLPFPRLGRLVLTS
jgi:ubiquinone/menaquinone biosynthesis C-methylase UbiE